MSVPVPSVSLNYCLRAQGLIFNTCSSKQVVLVHMDLYYNNFVKSKTCGCYGIKTIEFEGLSWESPWWVEFGAPKREITSWNDDSYVQKARYQLHGTLYIPA